MQTWIGFLLAVLLTTGPAEPVHRRADVPTPVFFCGEAVPTHQTLVARRLVEALNRHANHSAALGLIRQRSRQVFPIIEPYLARYHIPADFKYLPLVESALNGSAVSTKGAGGYWQLMPETARELGLTVNTQRDDRFDLRKSTDAACRYLAMLHGRLGSWTLTAAAYNLGMGRLLANIRQQQERNYYYLRLNAETGQYLYRILAFKAMFDLTKGNPRHPTEIAENLPADAGQVLLIETDMDKLIQDADTTVIDSVQVNDGLRLPNAAAVVTGGIRARLAEAGRLERGQRWRFQLLDADQAIPAGINVGDMLYAVVEDIDNQVHKVYLRADRVYSASSRRSYPLALGVVDSATGRLGITLPTPTTLPVGWVTTWKVL